MDMTARKKGRRVNYMLEFATVRYWQGQLNECGIKNAASNKTNTRLVYLTRLAAFSEWLPGRIFDMRVQAVADGRIVRETSQSRLPTWRNCSVSEMTGPETRKR